MVCVGYTLHKMGNTNSKKSNPIQILYKVMQKAYYYGLILHYQHLTEASVDMDQIKTRSFQDLKMLITKEWKGYIKARGSYKQYHFVNTCVLDAFLVGLHVCYKRFETVQLLFQSHSSMKAIMALLDAKEYAKAKALWLILLNLLSENCKFKMNTWEINVWSEVKDHLPIFTELVFSNGPIQANRVNGHNSGLSEFQRYGKVIPLGMNEDFILVNVNGQKDTSPPLHIKGKYNRKYELQFLLVWNKQLKGKHMVVCFNLEDRWVLYDNNPEVPLKDIHLDSENFGKQYPVFLAGYVKVSSDDDGLNDVPFGVPEDGSSAFGARPFNLPLETASSTRTLKPKND
ncbi:uncharacterized protein [Hoplias malabaricus]|uniref:uncharacterized protein n=1 Tax=Hoplias malabaricus TaxID=27720 RepID=UPI00346259FF